MAEYEMTLSDRTGRRIGILPPFGTQPIQYATVINGGGSATITPKLTLPLYSGVANRRKLSSWASEIRIERLSGPGELGLVWEGPVSNPKADLDSDSLTVNCLPVWAWLNERTIDQTLTYGGREQLDVARDIITRYTSGLGAAGDIRMTLAPGVTGTKISELYQQTDGKLPGDAVVDLASATGGFDFEVISSINPATGRTQRQWQWYYPTKGRKVEHVLSKGRGGLRAFAIEEATQIATRVTGTGQITYTAKVSPEVEAMYGVHSRPLSLNDSNSLSLLRRQVTDYLSYRTPPVDIVSFQYRVSDTTPFRFVTCGDSVRVVADRGWASYDDWVRVIGESVSVSPAGEEIVTLTAAGVPGGIS